MDGEHVFFFPLFFSFFSFFSTWPVYLPPFSARASLISSFQHFYTQPPIPISSLAAPCKLVPKVTNYLPSVHANMT